MYNYVHFFLARQIESIFSFRIIFSLHFSLLICSSCLPNFLCPHHRPHPSNNPHDRPNSELWFGNLCTFSLMDSSLMYRNNFLRKTTSIPSAASPTSSTSSSDKQYVQKVRASRWHGGHSKHAFQHQIIIPQSSNIMKYNIHNNNYPVQHAFYGHHNNQRSAYLWRNKLETLSNGKKIHIVCACAYRPDPLK